MQTKQSFMHGPVFGWMQQRTRATTRIGRVARMTGLILGLVIGINAVTPQTSVAGVVEQQTPERIELEFWRAIKDSKDAQEFEAYLETYPNGKFAPLARIRARSLKKSNPSPSNSQSNNQSNGVAAGSPRPAKTAPAKAPAANDGTAKVAPRSDTPPVPTGNFRDCSVCPEMVDVNAGSFTMGAVDNPETGPVRNVSLGYPFSVSRFEVTVEQWSACVAEKGCKANTRHDGLESNTPATNLSFLDAQDYVAWLAEYTGRSYRLLSEAEWEYMARAGSASRFWWGDSVEEGLANCRDCGGQWDKKVPVGGTAVAANDFGIHGVSGGVSEWVTDCWRSGYVDAPVDGTANLDGDCNQRVLRGGSWRSTAKDVTPSSRFSYDRSVRYVTNGIRVALDSNERPGLFD